MIRLLIWVGVALALLGFFYKILGRGGIHEEARRVETIKQGAAPTAPIAAAPVAPNATPAPVAATATAAVAPQAALPVAVTPPIANVAESPRSFGRGLSFALSQSATLPARVAHLACHGEPVPTDRPHRGSCNPYDGDTSCRTVLPIACYRSNGAAAPPGLEQDFYKGWTHGQLGATQPIMGAILKSEPDASARCEAELGPGWRMAEFHDGGGGWGLQGERQGGLRAGTRYWVHINDQRGNCWNSAP